MTLREGFNDFGPSSDDPVASKRRLRRMYTEAPPSAASSTRGSISGRTATATAAGAGAGADAEGSGSGSDSERGGFSRPDLDGIASTTAGAGAAEGGGGGGEAEAVPESRRRSLNISGGGVVGEGDDSEDEGSAPLQRNAMKLAAHARVSKAEKIAARKEARASTTGGN